MDLWLREAPIIRPRLAYIIVYLACFHHLGRLPHTQSRYFLPNLVHLSA